MNDKKEKVKATHVDRIVLDAKATQKLEHWLQSIRSKRKGLRLSKKDLVNWLIRSHSDELSQQDETRLVETFYDEERVLKDAWKEFKAAKARGEKLTLAELLGMKNKKPKTQKKSKLEKPTAEQHSSEVTSEN